MTDRHADRPRPRSVRTGRLEAFTDGVFAIAITLLVLELAVPASSQDHLLQAFVDEWPSYLQRADAALLRLNLLLLLVVAFLPFPTRLLAEYIHEDEAERVAVTIYGINLFLASVLVAVLWRYASRENLVRADASDEEIEFLTKRLTPGLALYVVLIGVGLLVPLVAVIGYLAIALYFIVPLGHLRRGRPERNRG